MLIGSEDDIFYLINWNDTELEPHRKVMGKMHNGDIHQLLAASQSQLIALNSLVQ
ncbi:hypothetical protein JOY44_22460 [Phormidium sp. CLA17]|uniref:hypothetical protein n=1 Tax=Leptolyngbya sp. Cla-17 TaxID=2803751 RepID=UPI001491424A|nr:hypothetical protein [Leptolyngbya sp. Cla-17]MBM0744340.1 hypothetical protein [Leptolyngbya sp. Cla-17]